MTNFSDGWLPYATGMTDMEEQTSTIEKILEGSLKSDPEKTTKNKDYTKGLYIVPYNINSKSFLMLKRGLKARVINKNFNLKDITLINWGLINEEYFKKFENKITIINLPNAVKNSTNKVKFLQTISSKGVSCPDFTKNTERALEWISEGFTVFGRAERGHSGKDILDSEEIGSNINLNDFLKSQFYTKYIPKKKEYRVHVFKGVIIDYQSKALLKHCPYTQNPIDPKEVNWKIRNLDNGFIFKRENVVLPHDVKKQALDAHEVSGLDFGAYDIIWNEKKQKAYVLEVNTAPGLMETTLDNYINAFSKYHKENYKNSLDKA